MRAGIRQIQEDGQGTWATVVALPRGFDESAEGLSMGDRVLIPSHEGVGATEFVEFGQGLRFMPFEDVLAIEGGT
jgi:co-chaperonin GroES (HSP10)